MPSRSKEWVDSVSLRIGQVLAELPQPALEQPGHGRGVQRRDLTGRVGLQESLLDDARQVEPAAQVGPDVLLGEQGQVLPVAVQAAGGVGSVGMGLLKRRKRPPGGATG